ncbi:MAG TPA: SAF domain-containing protein [Propionibacteriaceae bacterium]|nr:SAF domain-containing protein [Propionibacteriaceae bacterium]
MTLTSLARSLTRAVSWHRRPLAALCAAAAMLCLVGVASPPPPVTVAVVVAQRDLAAGSTLSRDDVVVRRFPVALAPSEALSDAGAAAGRTLTAALNAGTPLTSRSLSHAESLAAPGERLVPFRLSDASLLSVVSIGDLVTVVATRGDGTSVTVAERVRVAALPQPASEGGVFGSSTQGAVVVVSCPPKTAVTLAGWAATSALGIAIG